MTSPSAGPAQATAAPQGRRPASPRRRDRVIKALNAAMSDGQEISASGIALAAAVTGHFLYRQRDLLEQIHALQAQPPPATGTGNGPPSAARPCRLICSIPSSAPPASPPASSNSNAAYPTCLADESFTLLDRFP